MKTTVINENGKVLVKVQGMIDTSTAEQFLAEMTPVMQKENAEIVLDCTELEYISSKGLRVLLTMQQEIVKNGGTLQVTNVDDSILEIFHLTGFDKIFNL